MLYVLISWFKLWGRKKKFFPISLVGFSIGPLEERGHYLIICHVPNSIFNELLLFSIQSLCWMQEAKSTQDVWALEGVIDQISLERVFYPK